MVQNYSSLLKKVREMIRDYKSLDIDSKLFLLNLEMRIESKYIKGNDCVTKADKKKMKTKINEIRKHNEKKNIESR